MDVFEQLLKGPWRDLGLIVVPASYRSKAPNKESAEAAYIRSYITYSELFGAAPTWDQFFDRLRGLGLHNVMASLSFINSVMYIRGPLEAQTDLVNGTFDSDLKQRVKRLREWKGRVVYSPAQLMLVMKAAILYSPNREDEGDEATYARAMAEVLLMANDLLDVELRATIEAAPQTDDLDVLARLMMPHAIRATLANAADAYDTSLGRASIIFTQLASRDDVRARAQGVVIDVGERFKVQTGLSLQEYFAIGWALLHWFTLAVRDPTKNTEQRKLIPATFFSQTKLDPSLAAAILDALMHDYSSAKAAFESRRASGRLFSYDTVPFMERPLYRIRHDVAVPASLAFLAMRLSVGVYWILFDAMPGAERHRWSSFYGHIVEAYVRDTILRALPAGAHLPQRVFSEMLYRVGKEEHRTSDVVALYPNSAIFFEVTATRLRMDATRLVDDPAAVEEDFQKIIIGKAKQLHDRIEHFRQGRYSFGGIAARDIRSIMPVVVTGETIPMWTATMRPINNALKSAALLQQSGVERLRVIGVDELEMLEALTGAGVDLFDVLRKHGSDQDLRNVRLRNYLQRHYEVPQNQTLRAEYTRIGHDAARLLFGTSLGPPTHEEIARRAYDLFERRGGAHGRDLDDWLQAERELSGKG